MSLLHSSRHQTTCMTHCTMMHLFCIIAFNHLKAVIQNIINFLACTKSCYDWLKFLICMQLGHSFSYTVHNTYMWSLIREAWPFDIRDWARYIFVSERRLFTEKKKLAKHSIVVWLRKFLFGEGCCCCLACVFECEVFLQRCKNLHQNLLTWHWGAKFVACQNVG